MTYEGEKNVNVISFDSYNRSKLLKELINEMKDAKGDNSELFIQGVSTILKVLSGINENIIIMNTNLEALKSKVQGTDVDL